MEAVAALLWACEGLAAYAIALYAPLAWLVACAWPGPTLAASELRPTVTVLIAALDEADVIAAKIANTRAQSYPQDRVEILVVSDGSTDPTAEIARSCGAQVLHTARRHGKASALARGIAACTGQIVVMTDANALLAPDALEHLIAPLADPSVGAVAGAKRVRSTAGTEGEGLYWRIETLLKRADARIWSVMGAAGELLAIRRNLLAPPGEPGELLEPDTILDDFVLTMRLVASGWRVAFAAGAIAWEVGQSDVRGEFERKARIVAGGHQAVFRLGRLQGRRSWRIWWPYLSHRVLRWVAAPWLLAIGLGLNLSLAASGQRFYQAVLAAQVGFWAAGALGGALAAARRPLGPLALPWQLLLYWLAALDGAVRYYRGRQPAAWTRVARRSP